MAIKPYYTLATKDTVPQSTALTGTFTSAGKIITGTGTAFKTEVGIGDWLFSGNEVAEVIAVNSDTELRIKYPYSVEASGATVKIVPTKLASVLFMQLTNYGGSDTTIDGETFYADDVQPFGQHNPRGERKGLVIPKVVDGATSEVLVNLEWYERDVWMGFR